jgi:hypothetical protein
MNAINAVRCVAVAVLGLAQYCGTAQANLLTNGGFEAGSFVGWTQFGDPGFTIVTGTQQGVAPFDGAKQAIFGPINAPGGIFQTFAATPGAALTVTFSVANLEAATASFVASLNGVTLLALANPAAFPYATYSIAAPGDGDGTNELRFTFQHTVNYFLLDAVAVSAPSTTVPEPDTLVLLAYALLGLAIASRSRTATRFPFGRRSCRT